VDLWLLRLKNAVNSGDKGEWPHRYFNYHLIMSRTISPFVKLNKILDQSTIGEKAESFALLEKWWREYREKTQWDRRTQMLTDFGEEEFRRNQEKSHLENIERVLAAPVRLTREQLEASLAELFEESRRASMRDSVNFVLKFEKAKEGEWHFAFRQVADGPVYNVSISGPRIEETKDREFPYSGVFESKFEDGKISLEDYRFSKLENRWLRKRK
jgi:hypothetical protein